MFVGTSLIDEFYSILYPDFALGDTASLLQRVCCSGQVLARACKVISGIVYVLYYVVLHIRKLQLLHCISKGCTHCTLYEETMTLMLLLQQLLGYVPLQINAQWHVYQKAFRKGLADIYHSLLKHQDGSIKLYYVRNYAYIVHMRS